MLRLIENAAKDDLVFSVNIEYYLEVLCNEIFALFANIYFLKITNKPLETSMMRQKYQQFVTEI